MVNKNGSLPKYWYVRTPMKEMPGMRRLFRGTVIKHLNSTLVGNERIVQLDYKFYGMVGNLAVQTDRDMSTDPNPPEILSLQDYIELSPEYASFWLHIISLLRLTHDVDYSFNDLIN